MLPITFIYTSPLDTHRVKALCPLLAKYPHLKNLLWSCFTSAGGFLVGQFSYQNASQNSSWSLEVVWRERREQGWKFTGSRLCSCPCNPGLFVNPVTHSQWTKTSRLLQMICNIVHLPHPMPMLLLKNSPGVLIWSSEKSEDTIRALDSWVRGCKETAQRRRGEDNCGEGGWEWKCCYFCDRFIHSLKLHSVVHFSVGRDDCHVTRHCIPAIRTVPGT